MIQANELRIGNLVLINGNVEKIVEISTDCMFEEYEPIPLTPEILEKTAFEKVQGMKITLYRYPGYILNSKYYIYFHPNTIQIMDENLKAYWIVNCQYLHQLQNLTYALTGNELQINLHVAAKI